MRINDVIDIKKHEHLAVVLKSAYIHRSAEEDELVIVCIPIAGYVVKNMLLKEFETAIEEKLGKHYKIRILSSDVVSESVESEKGKIVTNISLNPLWTFDTFEMGKSNEAALGLSLQLANHSFLNKPKKSNNFLYLWGAHGVGKSHLLTAVAWRLISRGMKVAIFSGPSFVEFIVNGVLGRRKNFKSNLDEVLNADAFLIDDIQYLAGKERTQTELKKILDSFNFPNKIALFTADVPQQNLKQIKDEVTTRMMDGYTTRIYAPDEELKRILLAKYLSSANISLSNESMKALVSIHVNSVREVKKIASYIESVYLLKDNPTFNDIKRALEKEFIHIPLVYEQKIGDILNELFEERITLEDLQGKMYNKTLKEVRDIVLYKAVTREKLPITRISEAFKINKSTVSRALKNVRKKTALKKNYIESALSKVENI